MFSFGNLNQDEQNTPFFSDNQQKPSIFNTQYSDEISAFDLFNSNQNNNINIHNNFSSSNTINNQQHFSNNKQNGRQSKKSIISQLEQFNKKSAFKDLEQAYDSESSQIINFLKPQEYNTLAESRVKKFQLEQYKSSQSNAGMSSINDEKKFSKSKPTFNLDINFSKRNKTNNDMEMNKTNNKQNVNFQQSKNLGNLSKTSSNKLTNFQQKLNLNFNKQSKQKYEESQKQNNNSSLNLQSKQKKQIQNQPQKIIFTDQQFSFNLKLPHKQQLKQIQKQQQKQQVKTNSDINNQIKNIPQKNCPNEELKKSSFSNNQTNLKLQSKNTDNSSKLINFKPISFLNVLKQPINLKSSRALSQSKNVQNRQKEQDKTKVQFLPKIQLDKNINQNNKFSLNNFSNILKKSTVKENQTSKNNDKDVENQKFTKSNIKNSNQQIAILNANADQKKNTQNKINITKQPEKIKSNLLKIPKLNIPQINLKNQNKIQQKNVQLNTNFSFNTQKLNKPKQKPCFNLKTIKQPTKNQNKNEKQKKTQISNVLIQEQINKRENITTTKLLKDTSVFAKGLNFKSFDNKPKDSKEVKQFNFTKMQQKQRITPKIIKIQSKNTKSFNSRQTQKLKQQKTNKIQPSYLCDTQQIPVPQTQRIDYQLYQNQLNQFYDEIQQTKRKFINSQNGYKEVFLLLNKANMILNQKSFSQTQGNNNDNNNKFTKL